MFFIKIKVKGHLKNLTDNTEELIETDAIKKANVISYIDNKTKYKILVDSTKITLIREDTSSCQSRWIILYSIIV